MNIHHNARLTFRGRELLVKRIVEQGLRVEEAAQASGVSVRTAYKWLTRYRQEGITDLYDRSSRPRHCPHQTSAHRHQEIVRLRRLRRTYRQISRQLGVSQSTVGRVQPKLGLNRLSALEPAQPVNRYQHEHPGDLLHLDIKKLGRFKRPGHRVTGNRQQNSRHSGWEYVHVAIDDASRIAFSTCMPTRLDSLRCATTAALGSPTSAPDLTHRVPTARPSGSSRLRCVSGPMRVRTATQASVLENSRDGCTTTTGTDNTPESITNAPSTLWGST